MRKISFATAALAAALFAAPAAAQSPIPLALEIRGGIPFATGDFGDRGADIGEGLGPGYTVGANATLQLTHTLGVYAGYSYTRFDVEDFDDIDVTDKGLDAGVRAAFPTTTGLAPFLKAGLVYHEADVLYEDPQLGVDTDISGRELGFEVAGGVEVPLGRVLSFTPGVSYVQYETDAAFGDRRVSYVRADVGLRMRL